MLLSSKRKHGLIHRKCPSSASPSTANIYSNKRLLPHAPGKDSFLFGMLSNQRKASSAAYTLFPILKRSPVPNINITAKKDQEERKLLQNPKWQCPQGLWEQVCLPAVLWGQRSMVKPSHPNSFTRQKVHHPYFFLLNSPKSRRAQPLSRQVKSTSQKCTTVEMRRTTKQPSISFQNLKFPLQMQN